MTPGETTEAQGNIAKDHDPVLDREASTVRRTPPGGEHTNALAEAPVSAAALQ
jgi:hypothetical protein